MTALLERCRTQLLARRARLLGGIDRANVSGGARTDETARLFDELRAIDSAMTRMHDGTWGTCTVCGRSMGSQRLLAVPEASTCLDCRAEEADLVARRPLEVAL